MKKKAKENGDCDDSCHKVEEKDSIREVELHSNFKKTLSSMCSIHKKNLSKDISLEKFDE